MLAIGRDEVRDVVMNVGTGRATSVLELAVLLTSEIPGAQGIEPEMVGRFRQGDVRTCYADVTRAKTVLGFSAEVPLKRGVKELASWVARQSSHDRSDAALEELKRYRLLR